MKLNRRVVSCFSNIAALLIGLLTGRADELQLLWQISPADGLPYLTTDSTQRGVAYNPLTGHVLLVSRSDNEIHILDGQTGADLGTLKRGDIISGGTFPTSLIGVADDGAIYVANLTTGSGTTPFKVYRWASETAEAPTIAYEGDPGGGDTAAVRWGDSFDVRGSGVNTQFAAGAGGTSTPGAIFTTTDGLNFTATKISNFAANFVAFGSGNTIWTKRSGAALRRIAFNLATGEGTLMPLQPTAVPTTLIGIAVNPTNNVLAGINFLAARDEFRLYDISDTNNFLIVDQEVFPADNANLNAAGSSDISGDIVVTLDTNNGLMVFRVIESVTPVSFVGQPASLTLVEGAAGTLSASVSGTPPIFVQWQLNGTAVAGQTNSSLALTNVTLAQGGTYTLVASNAAGSMTSGPAILTVVPRVDRASVLWRLAPDSRPYLTSGGNTERGIAYNKVSNRVLLVSRTGDVNIHVLDADTGADLWRLQAPVDIVSGSVPAGFRLNMVGVADDGVVYAANLDTPSGASYQIYRWENDSSNSVPTIAWSGAPVADRRFGDTMDVRGSGTNTQILLASQNTAATDDNTAVIMTTTDGLNFTPNPITIAGLNDDNLRLGIAFGAGNTFWGKTSGQPLYQVQFDIGAGTGTIAQTYTNATASSTAVGVHPSSNLVAVIALETPDNLRMYDLNPNTQELTLIDQEYFATDNPNANGTGSVDFGNDRVYAIDTNNGILALRLAGGGSPLPPQFTMVSRTPTSVTFRVTRRPTAVRIQGTTDFITWTTVQTLQPSETDFTVNTAGSHRFYRALEL